jgi:flavin-dependent dehydrogenase
VAALPRAALQQTRGNVEAAFATACASLPSVRRLMGGARRVTPYVSAGPLGYVRRDAVDDGLLLVGDAASAINPMTGEGLAMALRGAELAAETITRALRAGNTGRGALAPYERARGAAFGDTWRVSRFLQWVVQRPRVAAPLFARLAGDHGLATHLLSVVSGLRPAGALLSPRVVVRLLGAG